MNNHPTLQTLIKLAERVEEYSRGIGHPTHKKNAASLIGLLRDAIDAVEKGEKGLPPLPEPKHEHDESESLLERAGHAIEHAVEHAVEAVEHAVSDLLHPGHLLIDLEDIIDRIIAFFEGLFGKDVALEQVQCRALRGFRLGEALSQTRYYYVDFPDAATGRAWIAGMLPQVTSAKGWDASVDSEGNWDRNAYSLNLAFTPRGLDQLDWDRLQLTPGPSQMGEAFIEGMLERGPEILGDTGNSAPDHWTPEYKQPICALVVISATADSPGFSHGAAYVEAVHQKLGVTPVLVEDGKAIPGARPGSEHFGYVDGIGQPAIGHAGMIPYRGEGTPEVFLSEILDHLIWRALRPGEFVLGYNNETGVNAFQASTLLNGSFLVVRKLHERVEAYREYMSKVARDSGMDRELVYAKLVGRWRSGAPLPLAPDADDPTLGADMERNDDFDYRGDPDGYKCPFSAHIRRANPRAAKDGPSPNDTKTHRIIRRGIPYGPFLAEGESEQTEQERGIFFEVINADIEAQFEFVQRSWMNNPVPSRYTTRQLADDSVIGANDGRLSLMIPEKDRPFYANDLPRFVETRGGFYLFLPSLDLLERLAAQYPAPLVEPRQVSNFIYQASDLRTYTFDELPKPPMEPPPIPMADRTGTSLPLAISRYADSAAAGQVDVRAIVTALIHWPGQPPLSKIDFEQQYKLYWTLQPGVPEVMNTFHGDSMSDQDFADQRVAGANPMVLRKALPADNPFTGSVAVPPEFDQRAFEARLADGRIFVADYADLQDLVDPNGVDSNPALDDIEKWLESIIGDLEKDSPPWLYVLLELAEELMREEKHRADEEKGKPGRKKYMTAPRAYFYADPDEDNRLVPTCIQVGQPGSQDDSVATPLETTKWKWARVFVQIADFVHQNVYGHFGGAHLTMEAFIASARIVLAADHPVHFFLAPFLRRTLDINQLAIQPPIVAFGPGGAAEWAMVTSRDQLFEMLARQRDKDFASLALPADVKARGLLDEDGEGRRVPAFPWRDDALDLWTGYEQLATGFVDAYYPADSDVSGDAKVQEWVETLGADSGARMKVTGVRTRADLVALLTHVTFLGSAQHASMHFPIWNYGGFTPNMCGASWAPWPGPADDWESGADRFDINHTYPPDITVFMQMLLTQPLYDFHPTKLMDLAYLDVPETLRNEKTARFQQAVQRFVTYMGAAEERISAADAARQPRYPYLHPSKIPFNIMG